MKRVPLGLKAAVVLLALVSPLLFPWQFGIPLGLAAGFVYPPLVLFIGFLSDILYYPGHGPYMGVILGVLGFALVSGVRYVVRTRIM